MKKFLFISFFFTFCISHLYAQSTIPAQLLCATTEINGDVTLTWSPSTEACGGFVEYDIYASNNFAGPYFLLTTIPTLATTNYIHVGAGGTTTTWYYYIVAVYNCPGYTITSSDTLDNLDPAPPLINYVTVTPAGVEIYWSPSPSPETSAYIIYRDIGGFNAIDTVYGYLSGYYLDVNASAGTQIETYTIAAMDSCKNIGPFSTFSHHTIFLTVNQISCSTQLQLNWNLYDTWAAGVLNYKIYADINGAGPALVATLANTDTAYTLSGINDGDNVCITVQAERSDNTAISVSNQFCEIINVVQPAQYIAMRNASVIANNQVQVEWYPDTNADLEKYSLTRSPDNFSYINIITQNIIPPIPVMQTYIDNSASTSSQSYYYKISTTDSCNTSLLSGFVRTILLSGKDNANFTNTLSWNAFEITNGVVNEYTIYRDNGAGLNLITTVSPLDNSFTDDVSAFINVVDSFCYRVEATYQLIDAAIPVDEQLTSVSNITCMQQGPRIYVPNAIVPGGVNSVFKPVIIYGEEAGYTMRIFNRYGQTIFETTDINQGWNGTYKNDIVPLGTYAYLIQFTATNGQIIRKKGNVTVVR